jgi:hypothetical protein
MNLPFRLPFSFAFLRVEDVDGEFDAETETDHNAASYIQRTRCQLIQYVGDHARTFFLSYGSVMNHFQNPVSGLWKTKIKPTSGQRGITNSGLTIARTVSDSLVE